MSCDYSADDIPLSVLNSSEGQFWVYLDLDLDPDGQTCRLRGHRRLQRIRCSIPTGGLPHPYLRLLAVKPD